MSARTARPVETGPIRTSRLTRLSSITRSVNKISFTHFFLEFYIEFWPKKAVQFLNFLFFSKMFFEDRYTKDLVS